MTSLTQKFQWDKYNRNSDGIEVKDFLDAFQQKLVQESLDSGRARTTYRRCAIVGCLPEGWLEVQKFLEEKHAAKLLFRGFSVERYLSELYQLNDGLIYFNHMSPQRHSFLTVTVDENLCDGIFDICAKYPLPPVELPKPVGGQVHMMVKDNFNNFDIEYIGNVSSPLNRGNYSTEVLKKFDAAKADILSQKPSGRLIILDGPPGTGKTFLVKGFMEEIPQAKFIIVPPHMMTDLANPDLLTAFIKNKQIDRRPCVLVIEDADECLAERKAKNMTALAAVLNLSDGIIGNLFSFHVIATTNTPLKELDAAILRPGRLSQHITVGELGLDDANRVLRSIVSQDVKELLAAPKEKMTLAEIYSFAKEKYPDKVVVGNDEPSEMDDSPEDDEYSDDELDEEDTPMGLGDMFKMNDKFFFPERNMY